MLLRVGDVVAKHEATSLAGVSVEVNEHFETLVLLGLLDHSSSSCPNGRVVRLAGIHIHSVQIAGHRVESVVAASHTVWIQDHDHLEDEVLAQATSLISSQTT